MHRFSHRIRLLGGLALCAGLVACGGERVSKDPIGTLSQPRNSSGEHFEALAILDGPVASPRYVEALRQIVIRNDYLIPIRKAAYQRLERYDEATLVEALDLVLGRLEPPEYRAWVIERIAAADRRELTDAIIRSWARPVRIWERTEERPEPLALAAMYGEAQVPTVLVTTLLDANPLVEANLRARCWELAVATGHADALVDLVRDEALVGRDAMLIDLRAAVDDFGVVPRNREEILWIRQLRTPEHRAYWNELAAALRTMDEERRGSLEPRDLAVAAAVAVREPALMNIDRDELYERLRDELRSDERVRHSADLTGWGMKVSESISDDRNRLTWGDLAAMTLAHRAMDSPRFRAAVFDLAERDLLDTTTEYGGLVRLDAEGGFELVEHPPRVRVADDRYHAPQSLFDEGYTALFHVHAHAQRYRNARYAGPHMGDFEYADETGANGLVFTFIDSRTINVDFYRHGSVVVDLGTITRPDAG